MAERIKKYIAAMKISTTELAKRSGLNVRVLYDIFNANRKIEIEEYAAICKGLNVKLDFFFDDKKTA